MRYVAFRFICFCLVLFLQVGYAEAGPLDFTPTLPLTLGLPGDNPDITRVAYNSRHDEYLVVYQYRNAILQWPAQIHAARLSANGEYIANYTISDLPDENIQPDLAYDPLLDRYLVVWAYGNDSNSQEDAHWDIHGRFVPWSGPVSYLPSFEIANGVAECNQCVASAALEHAPRIAYSPSNRDFLVVISVLDNLNPLYLRGYRVKADGTDIWKNLLIGPNIGTDYRDQDITYNSHRDEFMVVYKDFQDIYGLTVPGQQAVDEYEANPSRIQKLNMESPTSRLGGFHELPAVSYSPDSKYYIITWITNKSGGVGGIHARYLPGGDNQPTDVVYLQKLDPPDTKAQIADVTCSVNAPDCLITWVLLNNGTYFSYGHQVTLTSNPAGYLTGAASGFTGPLDNLSTGAAWASDSPHINVAAGTKQYALGFTGIGASGARYAHSRTTGTSEPAGWTGIAAGAAHILSIRHDGTPWSMWLNSVGQLGLGDSNILQRAWPTRIESDAPLYAIKAGMSHSLGVSRDGSLWAWGNNNSGQLGINNPIPLAISPQRIWGGTTWNTAAGGYHHSLAIRTDGALYSWGGNLKYQLGLGDSAQRNFPTKVGQEKDWIAVAAGMQHSLGIRADNSLWAWGDNFMGQLGIALPFSSEPARVGSGNNWVAIAAGQFHSLGIRTDGSLYAWGYNYNSQLGLGDQNDRDQPARVGSTRDWFAVAAGRYHSLGIRSDGSLYAWGANGDGQLGVGDTADRTRPARVGTNNDWVAISAGDFFSLGLRRDGTLWVWGWNPRRLTGGAKWLEPTQIKMQFPWNLFLTPILNKKQ